MSLAGSMRVRVGTLFTAASLVVALLTWLLPKPPQSEVSKALEVQITPSVVATDAAKRPSIYVDAGSGDDCVIFAPVDHCEAGRYGLGATSEPARSEQRQTASPGAIELTQTNK
ncbi:hypothetical protein AB0C29_25155 [Actinoplanes sp. NPDC048791]|uniref:hypothetical protein n=1 Tax=Actinoplanes sp. NPDC048791 TaxID=3154623 RepID=UPI0033F69BD1